MKIRFAPQAYRDIESIHNYVAAHNPDAARKLIQLIQSSIDMLKTFPRMG